MEDMITQNPVRWESRWQDALKRVVTDPAELLELVGLDHAEWLPAARRASQLFPLRVPRGFIARMEGSNPQDPLLRQILPLALENDVIPGYTHDPVGDVVASPTPGLIHKYQGRVLLTVTGACAVHCRYCFRRHFPYAENQLSQAHLARVLDYLKADTTVHEVILSGGDPLIASDQTLQSLMTALAEIPHVTTLRIHTRLPIVLPERITPAFIECLTSTRLQPVVVLHSNHAQEWDASVARGIQFLRAHQIVLLNQSVLLKGVNDTSEALVNLSQTLFSHGVLPYYLHLLDKVQGAAHFDVSEAMGEQLVEAMSEQLPGYLVPRLVREVAGLAAKQVVR